MRDIFKRLLLIFGAPGLIIILIWALFYTRTDTSIPEEISVSDQVNQEFEFIYKNIDKLKNLRNLIISKKELLNKSNCSGVLENLDPNSSYFNDTELIQNLTKYEDNNKSIIIYYNACNLNYTESEEIEFAFTSKYLTKHLFKQNDKQYFKGIHYKSMKSNSILKESYIPLDLYIGVK